MISVKKADKVKRVFLVEDDHDDQYFMQLAFEETDIRVDLLSFDNGQVFLQALDSTPSDADLPDLVILDLNMPVFDGKATLKRMKDSPRYQSIPVIVYTTSKSQEDVREAYRLGANSYIIKPPHYEEIIRRVKTLSRYWFDIVETQFR